MSGSVELLMVDVPCVGPFSVVSCNTGFMLTNIGMADFVVGGILRKKLLAIFAITSSVRCCLWCSECL